jgi:von Willebrand factor A domain-containing protein 3
MKSLSSVNNRPLNYFCQVIMSIDMMKQIEFRLAQAIKLYQKRLDWLTTESRRLFGVIEEKCVCIVLDYSPNLNQQQFDLYLGALEVVIREQISRVSRFNIIRYKLDCLQPFHMSKTKTMSLH